MGNNEVELNESQDDEYFNFSTFRELMKNEQIRRIIYQPRRIPMSIREDIAEIIADEIIFNKDFQIKDPEKFIEHYGAFYPIFITLKNTEIWRELKELASKNKVIRVLLFKEVLTKIFDLLESFSEYETEILKDLKNNESKKLAQEFKAIIEETLNLWGRRPNEKIWSTSDIVNMFKKLLSQLEALKENNFKLRDIKQFLKNSEESGKLLNIFISFLKKSVERYLSSLGTNKESNLKHIQQLLDNLTTIKKLADDFRSTTAGLSQTPENRLSSSMEEQYEYIENLLKNIIDILTRLLNKFPTASQFKLSESMLLSYKVSNFHGKETSQRIINQILQKAIISDMSEFIQTLKEHLNTLELLTLLFPLGWDFSINQLHSTYLMNLDKYSKLLEKNKELMEIIDMLGRIELEAGSKRLEISHFSTSEVYSVTLSKNIQYALPTELVKLGHDTLKYLFYAKFVEGKLLTYQLRGKSWVGGPPKKQRRGPVVALVDTSGSMQGAPEILTKTIILAVVKYMLKDKRDVKVILFSSINQIKEIELTNRKKMAREFLDFLNLTFGSGTDFNTALKAGLDSIKNKRFENADILFITDGLSVISDKSLLNECDEFRKKKNGRIFTIIVGNDTAGGLDEVSDYVFLVSNVPDWSVDESPARIIKFIRKSTNKKEPN